MPGPSPGGPKPPLGGIICLVKNPNGHTLEQLRRLTNKLYEGNGRQYAPGAVGTVRAGADLGCCSTECLP